ncbi:MAG: glycosyltransferase family 39 protein [Chloroflexota bacterium]
MFLAAAFLRFYRLDALPLGFHHDEALDSIAALEIWTKGQHPIFFPQQGSREPLMIYLESLGILALGATRLGARIAQACVGTAGVVAAWFLVREMFGRRVALLASACMAFSFWQMFESRLGLRAISQPLVEALCLLFFWRTLAHRYWRDAVIAGALLGLTMYTYTAARALPLLFVAVALWQLATVPAFLAKHWSRLLAVAGVALVVFAPLGVYALRHPEDFLGRSLQVNLLSPEPFTGAAYSGGVGESVLKTLGMFSIQGDPAWKYNIGGQPVFDWPMSALFYGGIVLALLAIAGYVRTRRAERPVASPHAFLLLWLAVMLLPGFLSSEAPHFLRTIGIMPGVFVIPALALSWLIERWRWAAPAAAVFLAGEGAETGYHYFEEWAHSPEAYYAMQADAADVAGYLKDLPGQEPVLFSSEYPGHPTLLYLAPKKFESIRWFNGREGLAFPPPGQPYLYVFTAHYQPAFLSLASLFRPDELVHEGRDPAGGVAYQVYRASPSAPSPSTRLDAQLGDLARLDGASLPATVKAGETFGVQEYWHALQQGTPDIRAFLHLVDAQGHLWAQADNLGYYAEDWQPGDTAVNDQRLELPAYAPPLPMRLMFGLYSSTTGQELPVRDASGASAGTQIALGTVHVQPGAQPAPGWRPPNTMQREVAPGLTLAGYDLSQTTVRAGDSLSVDLFWRTTAPIQEVPRLQFRTGGSASLVPTQALPSTSAASTAAGSAASSNGVSAANTTGGTAASTNRRSTASTNGDSAANSNGDSAASSNGGSAASTNGVSAASTSGGGVASEQGLADLLPPAQWPEGVIEDRRQLTIPPATAAGKAELAIGDVSLGQLTITEPKREFAVPPMEHQLGLPVGDFATLAGYTQESIQTGQPLRVTLFWQDRALTGTSWKVFVHLLDAANHVVAQKDGFPDGGQTPTTSWVPNQVVADRYEVPLPDAAPPGAQLEIGMYDPNSGRRLAIGPADHVLLPLTG